MSGLQRICNASMVRGNPYRVVKNRSIHRHRIMGNAAIGQLLATIHCMQDRLFAINAVGIRVQLVSRLEQTAEIDRNLKTHCVPHPRLIAKPTSTANMGQAVC